MAPPKPSRSSAASTPKSRSNTSNTAACCTTSCATSQHANQKPEGPRKTSGLVLTRSDILFAKISSRGEAAGRGDRKSPSAPPRQRPHSPLPPPSPPRPLRGGAEALFVIAAHQRPDKAERHCAIATHNERLGRRGYAPFQTGLALGVKGHRQKRIARLGQKRQRVIGTIHHIDAHHPHAFARQRHQRRMLGAAGRAPACPEVHHRHL